MKIAVVSGGYDPIHFDHVNMLKEAKQLGDMLIVGLNSDNWLERKKGMAFQDFRTRFAILSSFEFVDEVLSFDDSDDTACTLLEAIKQRYPEDEVIFCNGGDRHKDSVPEQCVNGIDFRFGIGGTAKAYSSSEILSRWSEKKNRVHRSWGWYETIKDIRDHRVKILHIMPGCSLSDQRHMYRDEFWYCLEGLCTIEIEQPNGLKVEEQLYQHKTLTIRKKAWHKTTNHMDFPCVILETQYGCNYESDIERRD